MTGYGDFSRFYDALMEDVDYPALADYYEGLFRQFGRTPHVLLDLGCGSGSLAVQFAQRGLDVIGVDNSQDMLSQAQQKAWRAGVEVELIHQDMQSLDLFTTVEGAVSSLDTLNHVLTTKELLEIFRRVSCFLEPGGLFLFDVNTIYKHREILGDQAFIREEDGVFLAWQNEYQKSTNRVKIHLDFFEETRDGYQRYQECFYERAYSAGTLCKLLRQARFTVVGMFDEFTAAPPRGDSGRITIAARNDKP